MFDGKIMRHASRIVWLESLGLYRLEEACVADVQKPRKSFGECGVSGGHAGRRQIALKQRCSILRFDEICHGLLGPDAFDSGSQLGMLVRVAGLQPLKILKFPSDSGQVLCLRQSYQPKIRFGIV